MTDRLLVVHCPDWPVVASGQQMQEAVAVVAANRVVACSEAARDEGVERGLRRRQAESRCPGLVVVADDPGRDARSFEPVVAAIEAFTPGVEIVRPGTCAFVTMGPSRYFGGDRALAGKVAAAVDAVLSGLAAGAPGCRVGIADGRLAAELAARSGLVVPRAGSRAFLASFPVSVVDGPATGGNAPGDFADLLVRLGIRTLGDLAALPMPAVLARFGAPGTVAGRLARGLDERPLAARTPPPDLAVTAELDPPADRLETVAFVARSLAEQLHRELATRGLAATRVLVEAETEHGEWLARRWRHDGGLTPAALAERVRWQIDGWLSGRGAAGATGRGPDGDVDVDGVPTGGLVLLRLTPDEVGADDGRQLGFWGGDRAAAERAGRALARVQGVLGSESVVTAVLVGGRGPAEQVRLFPWDDATGDDRGRQDPPERHRFATGMAAGGATARGATARGTDARGTDAGAPVAGAPGGGLAGGVRFAEGAVDPPWPGRIPPPAPATVHPRPLLAEVVDADGRSVTVTGRAAVTAPPARLAVGGCPSVDVVGWAGPWPVDERWWDPAAHRRRARAQVVTADGVAHLLAVEGGRWVVEATYD